LHRTDRILEGLEELNLRDVGRVPRLGHCISRRSWPICPSSTGWRSISGRLRPKQ
jgi:hypothetical protein